MSEDPVPPPQPTRVPTGVRGLDRILGGGLWRGGIYILAGNPGAGKTTFGNQVAFRHVADGGRAAYVTLLSETHARMLFQLREMSFFVPAAVGDSLVYLNGFSAIETEGLDGLLKMVRRAVRDQRAGVLILDGMVTAGTLARSGIDYKKFINELQTWVGGVGCTVLFLTSMGQDTIAQPESSMVDGIFELRSQGAGLRWDRTLTVSKFRGSAFLEGGHAYGITSDGVVVHPRLEALERSPAPASGEGPHRLSTGDRALDRALGGGLARGTSTLILGSTGSGKTSLALQMLGTGLPEDEPALYFGFFERPTTILARGDQLGFDLRAAVKRGALTVMWNSPAEPWPDRLADALLETAQRTRARRVAIDGLAGLRAGLYPERLPGFLGSLVDDLAALGATTLLTDEPQILAGGSDHTAAVATLVDNVVLLQPLRTAARAPGLLTVMKARNSPHERRYQHYEVGGAGLRVLGPVEPATPASAPPPRPVPRARKPGRVKRR
jgi:circadian clock protein KaiC